MAKILPRILSSISKAAVTLLLFWLLFRKINYAATLQHVRDLTPSVALMGVVILYVALAFATVRWKIVLRSIGRHFSIWGLFRLNLIGLFFNQVLPSVIGGDGMRVWLLCRRDCSFAAAFNSVLIDRLAGFVVLSAMSLYGLPTLIERLFAVPRLETIIALIVAGLMLWFMLYLLWQAQARIAKFRVGRFLAQIVDDVLFLAGRPVDSANILSLSIGNQAMNFVLIWFILWNLGANVSFVGVMIVTPVVLLLLVLPISIAGWGLREGLFVVGFGLLNVPKDVALAASIVFGFMNLVAGLIGGVCWIVGQTRSRPQLTKLQATAETSFIQTPPKGL